MNLKLRHSVALFAGFGLFSLSCTDFYGPPEATVVGISGKRLDDPRAPIEIAFSKPIDPSSLEVSIAYHDHDIEGDLPDEQDPPEPLRLLFHHSPDPLIKDSLGSSELLQNNQLFRINLLAAPPVGPEFVLLIEPGLMDAEQRAITKTRTRIPFAYDFECTGEKGTKLFPPFGYYFFVANISKPIDTQIRLWVAMKVNQETGAFVGQFTSAFRDRDPTRCDPPCATTEACRVYPGPPTCVIPSEKAGSVDEFADFLPDPVPPTGYSFRVTGCIEDTGPESAGLANASVDVVVQRPAVSVRGVSMNSGFVLENGVLRGTGSFTGDQVFIGTTPSGVGIGSQTMRSISEDELPPGIVIPLPEGEPEEPRKADDDGLGPFSR